MAKEAASRYARETGRNMFRRLLLCANEGGNTRGSGGSARSAEGVDAGWFGAEATGQHEPGGG